MSMFEDFKKFAFKGNIVDLAVGVVIGSAFGKIISALVAVDGPYRRPGRNVQTGSAVYA